MMRGVREVMQRGRRKGGREAQFEIGHFFAVRREPRCSQQSQDRQQQQPELRREIENAKTDQVSWLYVTEPVGYRDTFGGSNLYVKQGF